MPFFEDIGKLLLIFGGILFLLGLFSTFGIIYYKNNLLFVIHY